MNTTNRFSKKKSNNKTLLVIGIVSVLSLGSAGTYFALNHSTDNSSDKTSKSSTKENISDNQKGKLLADGIKEKTPADELIWRQFYNNDGIPMISGLGKKDESESSAAANDKPQIDENLFISAASNFVSQAKLNVALSFLGKTKAELEAANTLDSNSFEVAYNKEAIVDKVSIKINPSTPEQIIHYAGKPVSALDNLAVLYHGQQFDFIIHTTGGTLFNKMTIRPVPNQNTIDQQQLEPEQEQEQVQEQPQQQQVQVQKQEPQQPTEKKPKQKQPKEQKPGQQTQPPDQPSQPEPQKPVVDPPVIVEPEPEPEVPVDIPETPGPGDQETPTEPEQEPEETQRDVSAAS